MNNATSGWEMEIIMLRRKRDKIRNASRKKAVTEGHKETKPVPLKIFCIET